jgi:hypothetical protein
MTFTPPTQFCLALFLIAVVGVLRAAVVGHPTRHQQKPSTGMKPGMFCAEDFVQIKDSGVAGGEAVGAPEVQKLEDGRLKIGMVLVDPVKREISFPAKINQRLGLVEYALVTNKGKVHESVLVTQVRPIEIHLAALLLKLAPPNGSTEPGRIAVEVEWEIDRAVMREPLEKLIVHAKDAGKTRVGSALRREAWHYVGSAFSAEMLLDEAECGVISLISDGIALIQNPRDGKLDDELHAPNPNLPPGEEFPVVVHLLPFVETK